MNIFTAKKAEPRGSKERSLSLVSEINFRISDLSTSRMDPGVKVETFGKISKLLRYGSEKPSLERSEAELLAFRNQLRDASKDIEQEVRVHREARIAEIMEELTPHLTTLKGFADNFASMDIYDFYDLNWTLLQFRTAEHRLNKLSRQDKVIIDFDEEKFLSEFNSYFRSQAREIYSAWVVSLSFLRVERAITFYESLAKLTPENIALFTKLAKSQVLAVAESESLTFPVLEALRLEEGSRYFKIPALIWVDYSHALNFDILDLEGISEAEIETLIVLHGGSAYPSLSLALKAAKELT